MKPKNDNDDIISHDASDIVYGATAIGAVIGLTRRQAFYRLENGELPARKLGRSWVGRRSELLAAVGAAR